MSSIMIQIFIEVQTRNAKNKITTRNLNEWQLTGWLILRNQTTLKKINLKKWTKFSRNKINEYNICERTLQVKNWETYCLLLKIIYTDCKRSAFTKSNTHNKNKNYRRAENLTEAIWATLALKMHSRALEYTVKKLISLQRWSNNVSVKNETEIRKKEPNQHQNGQKFNYQKSQKIIQRHKWTKIAGRLPE